jgi:hypothetical protein
MGEIPPTSNCKAMIHAANVLAELDQYGIELDEFRNYWGSGLECNKAGNGDTWYSRFQLDNFLDDHIQKWAAKTRQ